MSCASLLRTCRYMSDCTCVVCSISSKWEIFSTSIGTGFRACQKCQQHQKVKIENETTWLVVEPTPLKNMKVNGKDDIPYMKWKIKNVWNHQPATYIGEGFFELSLLSLADNFCEECYFRDVMNWVTGAKRISCLAALRIVGNIGWAVATAVKNWPYIFAVTSMPSQRNSHHVCLVSIVLLNHVQSSSSQLLKMAI